MNPTRTPALAVMRRGGPPRKSERGVVVFIALIVLVAMMLAGIATLRSSGSAILTAGNLAFRQSATVSGDVGAETGITWLMAQGPITLETRNASRGYYPTSNDLVSPPPRTANCSGAAPAANEPLEPNWPVCWGTANWLDPTKAVQVNSGAYDAAGNRVSYVIHRMCAVAGAIAGTGAPANQECVTLTDPGKGGPKEAGAKALTGTSQVYYRITARIEGPKNTVSYVQTMVY
jgi:Tfp pilus assembly protein PilX